MVAPGEQSLRKQPRRQGQHASLDVEAVGITRPAIIASFDRQTVIPASCQSAAAGIAKGPPLCGTVGLDVGDHNVLPSQRNKSEQPHSHAEPAGDPPPRKNGRIDRFDRNQGPQQESHDLGIEHEVGDLAARGIEERRPFDPHEPAPLSTGFRPSPSGISPFELRSKRRRADLSSNCGWSPDIHQSLRFLAANRTFSHGIRAFIVDLLSDSPRSDQQLHRGRVLKIKNGGMRAVGVRITHRAARWRRNVPHRHDGAAPESARNR